MQSYYYIEKSEKNEFTLQYFCGGFIYNKANLGVFDSAMNAPSPQGERS